MTGNVEMLMSIIPIALSAFTVFYVIKNNKRSDTKDIEARVIENTKMNMKLDEIGRNVADIKYDISATKKDVQSLTERLTKVEASVKQAHYRIDRIDKEAEE
mgnify:CR=1 FL=1|jgi:peptidoglycan hydrolase CwlO-like protein